MLKDQQKLFFASGDLLSVAEAAKLTPYSQEYLSLLARKGRLPAIKITRDWITTRQAVLAYTEKQHKKHKKLFFRFETFKQPEAAQSGGYPRAVEAPARVYNRTHKDKGLPLGRRIV